jgi:hypothetical protein
MCKNNTKNSAKQKWSPDRLISFAAMFIALCALFVSIYNSYLNRNYLRKSTKPEMLVSFFYNDQGSGFMFGNVGLGSAYLNWFQILVDGKPQSSWLAMGGALGFSSPPHFEFVKPGRIYQINSYNKHFWAPSGPLDDELRKNRSRIKIRACYCSIFDECWIETDEKDPIEVKSCKPFPKILFGGFEQD